MAGQFEALTIDNTLTPEETNAIDGLKKLKPEELIKALKDEKIKTIAGEKSLTDIAGIFKDCISVDKDGKFTMTEDDKKTQPWLDEMITKGKDLAYFVYVVANALKTAWAEKLSNEKVNAETRTQLQNLRDLIAKTPDTPASTPAATPEVVNALTDNDITCDLKNWVTKAEVVTAVALLQVKLKADGKTALDSGKTVNDIIWYLKNNQPKELQLALGMKEGTGPLYERADGLFGKRTLDNLKKGSLVVPANTGNSEKKNTPKNKIKSRNQAAEKDETAPKTISSIDQLPITDIPAPKPTREYHMDMEIDDHKATIVFYPDYTVKFTGSNGREMVAGWNKSRDWEVSIGVNVLGKPTYMKYKNQNEFAIACDNVMKWRAQNTGTPDTKKASESSLLEKITWRMFIRPLKAVGKVEKAVVKTMGTIDKRILPWGMTPVIDRGVKAHAAVVDKGTERATSANKWVSNEVTSAGKTVANAKNTFIDAANNAYLASQTEQDK